MQHRVVCALPPPSNPTGLAKGFSLLEWTNQVLPQGQLVSGVKEGWKMAWMAMMRELAPQSKDGAYTRPTYAFGGRLGEAEFPAEAGRYHLYLGWVFGAADPDPVYDTVSPGFRGRCTAPLLVDRSKRAAVCNESADIVRGLDAANLPGATTAVQLRPPALAAQIDVLNARAELWGALDEMEGRLSASRFLLGDKLTECDVWLFPTIISDTLDLDAARRSYFSSLFPLNPGGIVPAGPTAADLQLGSRAPGRGGSSVLEEVSWSRYHLQVLFVDQTDTVRGRLAAGLFERCAEWNGALYPWSAGLAPGGPRDIHAISKLTALMRGATSLEILPRYFTRPPEAFELEDLDRYDLVLALDSACSSYQGGNWILGGELDYDQRAGIWELGVLGKRCLARPGSVHEALHGSIAAEYPPGPDRDYYMQKVCLLTTFSHYESDAVLTRRGGFALLPAQLSYLLKDGAGGLAWEAVVAALILSTASLVKYLVGLMRRRTAADSDLIRMLRGVMCLAAGALCTGGTTAL
eukprot:XP_001699024.1 predicted protein [Chlamydomonas reinhardtii]